MAQRPTQTKNPLSAIRDGDEAAFALYYESTVPWLTPLVRRITKDHEDAWDIVQGTFTKLWLARASIDPLQSLDGFVTKMSSDAAIDLLRKRQSRQKYLHEQQFVLPDDSHSAETRMLAAEMLERIRHTIASMPPQRRKVYELSRKEEMTYEQIASHMGISRNTVRNHMATALLNIRQTMSQE